MTLLADPRKESARSLMERVLGSARLASEQPLLFDERFPGRILALHEGSEVRSACALLTRDFLADGSRVRGGLIGSVATDPEWRSRGFATRVLIGAEARLQRQGCAFVLLWADDPDFYLRRGYGPIGREQDFVVDMDLAARLPEPRGARPMRPEDARAIHALYAVHPERVERSAKETAALLACPGMSTLVREHAGEVVAYACLGRGADLADAIHEWGGREEDVLALLRAHLEARRVAGASPGIFFMTPPSARGLCQRLTALGAISRLGMLGLGKILDREAAFALLRERIGPRGTVALDRSVAGRPFHFRGPRAEATLDDEGCLALLFGVEGVRADVAGFLANLGLEEARLPLDLFAWGLDSI